MLEAEIQVFAITVEVYFGQPRPFAKDKIDEIAVWLTDGASGFALRSDQVRVRHTDIVFDYEVSASFFGGNAAFSLNADRVVLSAKGAKTRQDADLLVETANRFVTKTALPEKLYVFCSTNAQASLGTEGLREEFLERYRPDGLVSGPGALGYVRLTDWPEDIRIAIEPSIASSESLFISWSTRFLPSIDSRPTFEALIEVMDKAANIYGVKFKPLIQ